MGSCQSCGHEYERHLFGGMCFYCDCKRAVYKTDQPVFLRKHDTEDNTKHQNGASGERKSRPRLGNK